MDTSTIATITVAVATGLGAVALTLPEAYKQLAKALSALAFLVYLSIAAWSLGCLNAASTLRPYIDASKLIQAQKAVEDHTPSVVLAIGCFWGVISYIWLLEWIAGHAIRARRTGGTNS